MNDEPLNTLCAVSGQFDCLHNRDYLNKLAARKFVDHAKVKEIPVDKIGAEPQNAEFKLSSQGLLELINLK